MSGTGRFHSFSISLKLEAIKYDEENSGESAAKKFQVNPKRIREWRKQRNEFVKAMEQKPTESGQTKVKKKTKVRRLKGGGRKPFSAELDAMVLNWIIEQRQKSLRVSRRMIREKAKELLQTIASDKTKSDFTASVGWLRRFMRRNNLFLRRRTTAQKDPDQLFEKIVSLIMYVSCKRKNMKLANQDLICMDETSLWFDMLSNTTVNSTGSKTVQLKSTGHEKMHATVVLPAKGEGTKLKPYIVFKKGIREVANLQNRPDYESESEI